LWRSIVHCLLSKVKTYFYHTWESRLREAEREPGSAGGLKSRISIKVGTIMRSRRNQGQCLPARNHKRNLYHRRLSSLHAERHGPPLCPVTGGEWMTGKFVTATALLLLTLLLGAQGRGFAQTAPAGQAPATPPATPAPAPAAQKPDSSQESADEVSSSRRK